MLGYDYTYHGWDTMFEEPHNMPGWCELAAREKRAMNLWFGEGFKNIAKITVLFAAVCVGCWRARA